MVWRQLSKKKFALRPHFIACFKMTLHKLYVTIELLITEVKFQIEINSSKKNLLDRIFILP